MAVNMALALIIVFLVMAVLFESFFYPLIIMLSVPVAAVGGIAGLAVLNLYTYQALDMLTMLGFVILIGIVVNNAILLVHQTLHLIRGENMQPLDAIQRATRNRIRPIFMSTLTSIFGMLPLVLFPGALGVIPRARLGRGRRFEFVGDYHLAHRPADDVAAARPAGNPPPKPRRGNAGAAPSPKEYAPLPVSQATTHV